MDHFTSMIKKARIIQLGSFTALANEIGLTQSAVSKNMNAH
ncbi:MAG: LysR family transcriptional regulator [Bermanella sp.]